MLPFLGKPIAICAAAILFGVITSGSSLAQGKSPGVVPPGAGPPSTSGSGPVGTPTPSASQSSDLQASVSSSTASGGSAAGVDGKLQSLYSVPLTDTWSLQMGVGLDAEAQSRSNPTGDINGRVGLGFKF
jgi:hypothetical protein